MSTMSTNSKGSSGRELLLILRLGVVAGTIDAGAFNCCCCCCCCLTLILVTLLEGVMILLAAAGDMDPGLRSGSSGLVDDTTTFVDLGEDVGDDPESRNHATPIRLFRLLYLSEDEALNMMTKAGQRLLLFYGLQSKKANLISLFETDECRGSKKGGNSSFSFIQLLVFPAIPVVIVWSKISGKKMVVVVVEVAFTFGEVDDLASFRRTKETDDQDED